MKIKVKIDGMSINGIQLVLLDEKGNALKKLCPHCSTKKVISEFGLRAMTPRPGYAPVVRLQPWCTPCRGAARAASNR
jgi:hypothetical protein